MTSIGKPQFIVDKRVDWNMLSENKNALHILEENLDKIYWKNLIKNTADVKYLLKKLPINYFAIIDINSNTKEWLEDNLDIVSESVYSELSKHLICVLEKKVDKINWSGWHFISKNPNAVGMIEKNLDKIDWASLSENKNAIHILEKNLDKVDWSFLCLNPNAIHILEKNLDKLNWHFLCQNPNAIHILEKNLDKINWNFLCLNPNAIHILEKNLDKVNWSILSVNPNAIHLLTKLDTNKMKKNMKPFAEELVAYVFHPVRLNRISERLGMDLDDLLDTF